MASWKKKQSRNGSGQSGRCDFPYWHSSYSCSYLSWPERATRRPFNLLHRAVLRPLIPALPIVKMFWKRLLAWRNRNIGLCSSLAMNRFGVRFALALILAILAQLLPNCEKTVRRLRSCTVAHGKQGPLSKKRFPMNWRTSTAGVLSENSFILVLPPERYKPSLGFLWFAPPQLSIARHRYGLPP